MRELVDNFNRDYIKKAAEENEKSVKSYYEDSRYNYVILEGNSVITWDNDYPIIFGSKDDAIDELKQWGANIRNISIITERELLECHCADEVKLAIAEEVANNGVMDSNSHDEELVRKINDAWNKNSKDFRIILCALYRRDIEEITDADSFRIKKWEETKEYNDGIRSGDWRDYNKMALEQMCDEWDSYATNYLEHIADDCDLECILNFLHYPYLPIYKD